MERIIFLDIDGVLNGHEWIHRKDNGATWSGSRINSEPSRILHRIIEQSSAKVVLISSWRGWINHGSMTPIGFANVLRSHGVESNIVDALPSKDPNLNHGEDRALKLLEWLKNNDCLSYVVLEDIDLSPFGVENQIKTDPRIGLVERHVPEVMAIFEAQEPDMLI